LRVVVPQDLLARVVKESLTLAENLARNAIENKARAAGLSEAEIEPQLRQAALGEQQKTLVADLAPFVLEEWGIDARVSPTLAVVLVLTPWAFGSWTAYATLAKLAKQRARHFPPAKPAAKPARDPGDDAD